MPTLQRHRRAKLDHVGAYNFTLEIEDIDACQAGGSDDNTKTSKRVDGKPINDHIGAYNVKGDQGGFNFELNGEDRY